MRGDWGEGGHTGFDSPLFSPPPRLSFFHLVFPLFLLVSPYFILLVSPLFLILVSPFSSSLLCLFNYLYSFEVFFIYLFF